MAEGWLVIPADKNGAPETPTDATLVVGGGVGDPPSVPQADVRTVNERIWSRRRYEDASVCNSLIGIGPSLVGVRGRVLTGRGSLANALQTRFNDFDTHSEG